MGLQELTEIEVSKCTQKTIEKATAIPASATLLKRPRKVELSYGNWKLLCEVKSIEDEVESHIRCCIRHWCVQVGKLTPLAGEKELVTSVAGMKITTVAPSLYKKAQAARSTFAKVIAGESDLVSEKLTVALLAKNSTKTDAMQ
eukprot:1501263-Amphidinium_carterae.1